MSVAKPEDEKPYSRQEMMDISNLFAGEESVEGLGPTDPFQADAFDEADEPEYIDDRESTGVHCMDDNVTLPGVQVPGGLIETFIASDFMNPKARKRKVSDQYRAAIDKAIRVDPTAVWMHGLVCAAGTYRREGLRATANNPSDALEFTGIVLDELGLDVPERDINEAIYTGGERADEERLWDISFHSGLAIARRSSKVQYEEFPKEHIVAGLRIDATPHRFNNELFKQDHVVGDEQVGVLSVTVGAYKGFLEKAAEKGTFSTKEVPMAVTYLNLFTFGLARAKVHSYTQAGLVVLKKPRENEISES